MRWGLNKSDVHAYGSSHKENQTRSDRAGGDSLRRRFRRRHADHRQPVHEHRRRCMETILPRFQTIPAEIRAPAGTVPGVSGFQLNFSSGEVYTPGDSVDVLIAMNPAALKMNVARPEGERHPDHQFRQLSRKATCARRT